MKWLKCLAIAVIYFLLARISYLTTLPAHVINGPALAWLPTGFAVAAILVEGYWIWPGIMLGSLLSAFPSIETWPGIAGFVLADTIDPLLATWLPRRILGREFDLCCGWDVTVFILVVAFGSSVFSATVGSIAVILAHGNDAGIFWQTFIVWWVSDFLSVLIFAPFLLAWSHKLNTPAEAAGKAELFIGAGICAGMIYFIFSMPLGKDTGNFIYWLIPLVIWLGFRAGRRGVSTGIFLLAVITIVATSLGKGPFVEASIEESFLYVQSFLTVISILGLLLTAALGERTKAIQDRDNFFLLASHELNTPLTVLGMQSFFLRDLMEKDKLEFLSPAQRRDIIRINVSEIKKMTDLVTDLLLGARIVAGRMGLELKPTDLKQLVATVICENADITAVAGVQVHINGDQLRGNWDEAKISFVVKTLFLNAVKYGQGRPIEISHSVQGNFVVLNVQDRGIGIPKELQSNIFERFGRLGQLRFLGGLGQGLFISRAIVKAHGGDIVVKSNSGQGTIFSVKLPV